MDGRYPWQLSGGMQQRVSIARALASRPAVGHAIGVPWARRRLDRLRPAVKPE